MNLSTYTDKSFVISGNTKEYRTILKEMGGKWNSNLSCGSGWIFTNSKRNELETWLKSIEKDPPVKPTTIVSTEVLVKDFADYIRPLYTPETILDILYDFTLNCKYNTKLRDDDDLSVYFDNDNSKLYQQYFLFMRNVRVPYSLYSTINKDTFIEYALLTLAE
jgi:hypothetical protein